MVVYSAGGRGNEARFCRHSPEKWKKRLNGLCLFASIKESQINFLEMEL
jgi:hypothetical protein